MCFIACPNSTKFAKKKNKSEAKRAAKKTAKSLIEPAVQKAKLANKYGKKRRKYLSRLRREKIQLFSYFSELY